MELTSRGIIVVVKIISPYPLLRAEMINIMPRE
jgi:hypothetical protein